MGTAEFPVSRIHAIAAASCLTWCLVHVLVHLSSRRLWPEYRRLPRRNALAWSNRITCAAHALVLVCGQAPNLLDPTLFADPLFAVSDGHFAWGSVMYGYLIYDTTFTVAFYRVIGSPSFLVHHALGLACCCFGLYFNKGALFGMAIEVFFESTTPLLHLLGCLKIAGASRGQLYLYAGVWLIAQFFVCRVVIASWFWLIMIRSVAALPSVPPWAASAVLVFGALVVLNVWWLALLVHIAARHGRGSGSGPAIQQQPSMKLDQPPPSLTTMTSAITGGASLQQIQADAVGCSGRNNATFASERCSQSVVPDIDTAHNAVQQSRAVGQPNGQPVVAAAAAGQGVAGLKLRKGGADAVHMTANSAREAAVLVRG